MSVSFKKNGIVSADGDNIGENILIGTHRPEYTTTVANDRPNNMLSAGSGGNGTFSITTEQGLPVGIYSFNITGNTSGNRDFQQGYIPFISGEKYTASWWAKGNGTCLFRSWNRTNSSQVFQHTYSLSSEWTFHSHTYTATQAMQDNNCTFHLGVTGAANIKMCGMKLEKGSVATPWSLNPLDAGYVPPYHGFVTFGDKMSVYPSHIYGNDFIEY